MLGDIGRDELKPLLERECSVLLRPDIKILTIDGDATSPHEAFKQMVKHHVLSAPCYSSGPTSYCGYLEMRDLVSMVCQSDGSEGKTQHEDGPARLRRLISNIDSVAFFKAAAHPKPAAFSSAYLARRHPIAKVTPNTPLREVCQLLAKEHRRVCVCDDEGVIIDIISQSNVVTYLNRHAKELERALGLSLRSSALGASPVLSIAHDQPARDAFKLMEKHRLHGVAIVDEAGKLVGNTSSSDLKLYLIANESIDILNLTVMSYTEQIRQGRTQQARSAVLSLPEDGTVGDAINKVSANHIHRVFVTNDNMQPTKVVSLTDIIKYIVG